MISDSIVKNEVIIVRGGLMKIPTFNKLPWSKRSGFTLIIIAITLIAIAIMLVPQLLNLATTTPAMRLEQLHESIHRNMRIVNDKSTLANEHKQASATVTADIATVYGYPAASAAAFNAFLDVNFATGSEEANSEYFNLVVEQGEVVIFPSGYSSTDGCRITYAPATGIALPDTTVVTPPAITLVTTGC
jgi:MSHA pilin protein MshA